MNKLEYINQKYIDYIVFIFPLTLLTGPFFTDLLVVISGILVLTYIISKKIWIKNINLKIFIYFFLSIIISSLINFFFNNQIEYDEKIISLFKSFAYLRFLLFFMILYLFISTKNHFLKIYKISSIIIYFLCLDTCYQYVFGENLLGFNSKTNGRLTGIFDDEAIIGGVILKFFLIQSISFFVLKNLFKNNYFNISYLLSIMLILPTIIFTLERTSLLLFIFSLILIILFLKETKIKLYIFSCLSILIIVFYSIFPNALNRWKETGIDFNTGIYTFGYISHFYSAGNMFLDNPLFGVGIKNFRNNCEYYKSENFNIDDKMFYKKLNKKQKKNFFENLCSTHPHSTYFELISEIGLYGLVTFFILIFNFYLKIYKSNVRPLIIPIIILLFPFLPSGSFFNNYNSAFFWLIVGLTFAAKKNLQKKI